MYLVSCGEGVHVPNTMVGSGDAAVRVVQDGHRLLVQAPAASHISGLPHVEVHGRPNKVARLVDDPVDVGLTWLGYSRSPEVRKR